MKLEQLYPSLLLLLSIGLAYRVLPILQHNFRQGKTHNDANRLPGLLFVLLLMPVFVWVPLTISDTPVRGVSAFILLYVCPSKLLSIAWDNPIDNLPPGFLVFAIASLIPARIKGLTPSKQKPGRSFENSQAGLSKGLSGRFSSRSAANSQNGRSDEPSRSYGEPFKILGYRRFLLRLSQTVILLAVLNFAYFLRGKVHIWIIYGLYCGYIYFSMEVGWDILAKTADLAAGLETDACFGRPFLAISLAEFWGRRWNLVVNAILRATVYDPIVEAFQNTKKQDGKQNLQTSENQWRPSTQNRNPKSVKYLNGRVLGTLASFLVSGLVHEAIFCYINQSLQPTWEVTMFFVLHGFATVATVYLGKKIGCWKLVPKLISRIFTLGFLYATVAWLFMPALVRSGNDLKTLEELHNLEIACLLKVTQFLGL